MGTLNDPYYDAIVISDEIDPNHAGAVRAKILGVTDDLDIEFQPFISPIVDRMQAVPTKGTYMLVRFDDGDINKGKYFHTSPVKTYLPDDYVSDYPNVAVCNLGGDFFHMVHNRRTRTTEITHPSNSKVTWTASGALIHDSDKGYNNAGYGAINTQGTKIHPVLTEATIDPFTCTPYGNNVSNGGAYQGSEYMFVTHMSKSVADAINGTVNNDFETEADKYPSKEVGGSELETKPLYDENGSSVGSVPYYPVESFIEKTDKEISRILVVASDNNDFVETSYTISDSSNNESVHYLVGRSGDDPPIDSERDTDGNKASGFIQFVETKNDVHYASDRKLISTDVTGDNSANENAVVIMLIAKDDQEFTDYQYTTLNKLINHLKYEFKDNDIPINVASQFVPTISGPNVSINMLDSTRLGQSNG